VSTRQGVNVDGAITDGCILQCAVNNTSLSGNDTLLVVELPAHLTVVKLKGDQKIDCLLCGEKRSLKDMRSHVGQHVLFAMRDIDEDINLKPGMKVYISFCSPALSCNNYQSLSGWH